MLLLRKYEQVMPPRLAVIALRIQQLLAFKLLKMPLPLQQPSKLNLQSIGQTQLPLAGMQLLRLRKTQPLIPKPSALLPRQQQRAGLKLSQYQKP
jgi:hypothetical protein